MFTWLLRASRGASFFWIRDRLQIVDTLPRQAKAAFGVSVGVCTTEILLCDLVVSRALLLQAFVRVQKALKGD